MTRHWLIKNARLINEGQSQDGDLRIRHGRIDQIGSGLTAASDETIIEARQRWLLPGMIDDQVHCREPGLTHKGDLQTESAAAVAGGVTSFMEMPNTRPPAVDIATLEAKFDLASRSALTNHSFYLGATNDNLEQIKQFDPRRACGIKIFMGASTGNLLVDNPDTLDAIFREAPGIVVTHCEDTPMITANQRDFEQRFGDTLSAEQHPLIRSREACMKSTQLALALARRHRTRLHVLHISSAEEAQLFEPGPIKSKRITAETCVHYLHFDAADYPRLGNFIKCNPAIKEARDRLALIAALAEGRIDVLATDHAPHTLAEKQQPYSSAPAGLPLVQFALQCALERVFAGQLTVHCVVERFAHAPARLFGVVQRGFLREGYWADLVLVDPHAPQTVSRADVFSRCGWSPFEGETFRSRIDATFVNGRRVWCDQKLDASTPGMRLEFAPRR